MAGTSLLTLLDDIATILDDVSTMTGVAARKTAGVLGDDLGERDVCSICLGPLAVTLRALLKTAVSSFGGGGKTLGCVPIREPVSRAGTYGIYFSTSLSASTTTIAPGADLA